MLNFFYLCYRICLFKKGPQDLLYSFRDMLLATLTLLGIVLSLDSLLEVEQENIVVLECIAIFCAYLFVAFVLWIANKLNRYTQSLTALLGVECWINLLMVIFVIAIMPFSAEPVVVIFSGVIYLWRLAIVCHIFRNMLSTDYVSAILLTVTFEMMRIIMVLSLMTQAD